MNKVSIYTHPCGDWQAMYENGERVAEDHEIKLEWIAACCPIESISETYLANLNEDDFDHFPENESDIPADWK